MMALREPGWDDAPGHAEADGHHQDRGLGGLPHQEPGQPEYFTHSSSYSAGTPIPSSTPYLGSDNILDPFQALHYRRASDSFDCYSKNQQKQFLKTFFKPVTRGNVF